MSQRLGPDLGGPDPNALFARIRVNTQLHRSYKAQLSVQNKLRVPVADAHCARRSRFARMTCRMALDNDN